MSLHILIISDNESFAAFLEELLGNAGHTTNWIVEEKEASRAIRRQSPDLIIVAVEASKVPRFAVERRLHTPAGPYSVPVIVISESLRLEGELLQIFDFIPRPLDVKRLFEDLASVASRKANAAPDQELLDNLAAEFSDHILSSTGLHFDLRNQAALGRGLRKRMLALRMESYDEYLYYLKQHGEDRHELQKLLQFLTVGETYFFRYPAHFDAFREQFANAPAAQPIRIWSAGCSTGEEPYSIAMTLMETLPDWKKRDIRIIATDINNRSLKRAREGVYSPWSMRITSAQQLKRYFERVGESFLIKGEVKQLVRFSHLNLSVPCPEPVCDELHDLDAIFCRNVLIYFTPERAEEMLQRFAQRLKPGGLLFLGHSETLLQRGLNLELRRQDRSFYYVKTCGRSRGTRAAVLQEPAAEPARQQLQPEPSRKAQAPRQTQTERPPKEKPLAPAPSPAGVEPAAAASLETARQFFDREEFDAALSLLEQLLEHSPDHQEALVLKGFIQAGKGEIREALETCARVIAVNDLLPEAYFLKGVLLDASDRLAEAAEEYRKALLLDHDFIMPRYHMGRLHLRQGRTAEAAREIRNSIRILSRRGEDETVPFSGGLTRAVCMLQLQNALAQVA